MSGSYWDVFLPLQGPNSIIHRTAIIKRLLKLYTWFSNYYFKCDSLDYIFRHENKSSVCGSIALYDMGTKYQTQMATAQVILRYPLVGRVIFRQPKDEPWTDTTVIFEYLVHADGANLNNSFVHRWAIHDSPPNQDFYNWTGRCLSAGKVYNPYKVDFDPKAPDATCSFVNPDKCRMGDMSTRYVVLIYLLKKIPFH